MNGRPPGNRLIQHLRMGGLLSFPPDMGSFELQPLNVLIGPNGSGKTNFIEVWNSCGLRQWISPLPSGTEAVPGNGFGKGLAGSLRLLRPWKSKQVRAPWPTRR